MRVAEVLGWIGFVAILASYFGLTSRRLLLRGFHALNLLGGVCLAANAYAHGAWPLAALNAVYAAIAVFGLAKRKSG